MNDIAVIGTGYVGLTTGVAFADMGNRVVCLDIDQAKIDRLNAGKLPIHEPGLAEVLIRSKQAERLVFTTSYEEALARAEFVFIAVGTPDDGTGGADLSQVRAAAQSIAKNLKRPVVVVNKSTVPIGTGDLVTNIIDEHLPSPIPFSVVSNPEFLREGSALLDCMQPDRVVLGGPREAAERVAQLYRPLGCPVIVTDLRTAEMIKYASNAFLATRISFINEIAAVCERLGADVKEVARGMGLDQRIGPYYLNAGLGFGGSCFPKDVKALMRMATDAGQHPQLLQAVMDINSDRQQWVVERLTERLESLRGKRIGILGIAFKPDTDDVREAPALRIVQMLRERGAEVRAYDPEAGDQARRVLPDLDLAADPYDAASDADAVVLVTEWKEFLFLDMRRIVELMSGTVFVDGRNVYDPAEMRRFGFDYLGVARAQDSHDGAPIEERFLNTAIPRSEPI